MSNDNEEFEYQSAEWDEGNLEDYGDGLPTGNEQDNIMNKLPLLIGMVLIVFVMYYLYTTLIGTEVETTFTITTAEGTALSNNSIQIQSQDGSITVFRESGKALYKTNIKTGSYLVNVSSPGYLLYSEPIEITPETTEFPITLQKDVKVTVTVQGNAAITIGEQGSIPIEVTNQGNVSIPALELEIQNLSDPNITVIVSPVRIVVPAQQTVQATLNVTIPSTFNVGTESRKTITGKIKVKGTNAIQDFEFTIVPKPQLEVTPTAIVFTGLQAGGAPVKQTITVRNKSPVSISNVEISVEIVTSSKNPSAQVIEWVTFLASGASTYAIPTLGPNESKPIDVQVQAPVQAKIETITGNIVVNSISVPEPVKRTITFQVSKEVEAGMEVSATKDTVQLTFDTERNVYKKNLAEKVNVKNTGDMDLENVTVSVKNGTECTDSWLKFEGETTIRKIAKNTTGSVFLTIQAPTSMHGTEASMVCTIKAVAINKVNNQTIEETKAIRILPQ